MWRLRGGQREPTSALARGRGSRAGTPALRLRRQAARRTCCRARGYARAKRPRAGAANAAPTAPSKAKGWAPRPGLFPTSGICLSEAAGPGAEDRREQPHSGGGRAVSQGPGRTPVLLAAVAGRGRRLAAEPWL